MKIEKTLKESLEELVESRIDKRSFIELIKAVNNAIVDTNEQVKKMNAKERKEFKKRLEWCLKYAEENNENRKNED